MLSSNITRDGAGKLCFAGQAVSDLAEKYGTPLYLMDEARLRSNCRMYINAFREHFPAVFTAGGITVYDVRTDA